MVQTFSDQLFRLNCLDHNDPSKNSNNYFFNKQNISILIMYKSKNIHTRFHTYTKRNKKNITIDKNKIYLFLEVKDINIKYLFILYNIKLIESYMS